MFRNISWSEYSIVVLVALLLYYVWIFFIFYAGDILKLFRKEEVAMQTPSTDSEEMFRVVYHIRDEIKETLEEAGIRKYGKEEILISLHSLLDKYGLQSTPFQIALNNFINRQCQHNCSIHLTEDGLNQLWG